MSRAAEKIHEIVRASAGTGKTYRLSGRYLTLLDGGVDPSRILATTFTRKAAGEILERVLRRLALAAHDDHHAAQLSKQLQADHATLAHYQRMLQTMCRSLHRVSISTLDSFFNAITRCFHLELDYPPGATVVDDAGSTAAQLRMLAIEAMLSEGDPVELVELLRRVHHDSTVRSVSQSLDQMVCNLYNLYREALPTAWQSLAHVPQASKTQCAQAVADLRDYLTGPASARCTPSLSKALATLRQCAESEQWADFITHTICVNITCGKNTYGRTALTEELIELLKPIMAHARAVKINQVAMRCEALGQLLSRFAAHYDRMRFEHRIMLYSDAPLLLSRQLPELDEIYFRLDGRIDHLMLDEFQDTSVQQWQVLLPLAEQIAAAGDVDFDSQLRKASRSFFCVGDVKQAIYGWRGGCAAIFSQVEEDLQLPPDAVTTMVKSWRSSQVVLDAVNTVFQSLTSNCALDKYADAAAQWQQRFEPHVAAHADQVGYVELQSSPAPATEHDETAHFDFVVHRVEELIARSPGRSIGILVSRNATVAELIFHLRARGIAASGEGNNPLTDDAAVHAVLSAFRFADHPGDCASAYHVLHSPFRDAVGLESLDATHRIEAALRIRQSVLREGYAHTIARWTSQIATQCSERNIQRLTQLIEIAEQYEPMLTLRCSEFVNYIIASRMEEPTASDVRVMTVHKSKGLEFDLVVLPELSCMLAQLTSQLVWSWRPHPTAPPEAIYPAVDAGALELFEDHCPQMPEARRQEETRRLDDDLSGLYVAMTRARYALYMIVPAVTATNSGGRSTRNWTNASYASILRQSLSEIKGNEENLEGRQILYQRGEPQWAAQLAPRTETQTDAVADTATAESSTPPMQQLQLQLAGSAKNSRRYWPRISPSSLEAGGRVQVSQLLALTTNEGMQRGSIIHAWFEQIHWLGDQPLRIDPAILRSIAAKIDPLMQPQRLDEAVETFEQMLTTPGNQQILRKPPIESTQTVELWKERDFAVRIDDRLLNGTFDRVAIIRDNLGRAVHAHLVDFKTDTVSDDERHLDTLIERYTPQLAAYRRALAKMLKLPDSEPHIEATLLFVGKGIARKIPPDHP